MTADSIKHLREERNLTQTELSKLLEITRSSVNAWEMGITVPSTQYGVELSNILRFQRIICKGLKPLLQSAFQD